MVAAQPDAQGDSLVAFSVEAITEGDNEEFGRWVEQRLVSTLGRKSAQGGTLGTTPSQRPTGLVPQDFVTELGKGVALGLHALSPFKHQTGAVGGWETWTPRKGTGTRTSPPLWGSPRSSGATNYRTSGRIFKQRERRVWTSAGANSWQEWHGGQGIATSPSTQASISEAQR